MPRLTPNSSFVPQRQFNYASFYENNGVQHPPPPPNGFSNRSANSQFYSSQPSTNGYSHRSFTTSFQKQNIVKPAMKHYAPFKSVSNCVPAFKPISSLPQIMPLKTIATPVASIPTPATKSDLTFFNYQFFKPKAVVIPDEPRIAVKNVAVLSDKSSSGWSAGSGQGTCTKTSPFGPFAEFLNTQKKPTVEKILKKVQKAEEVPKVNCLKVEKFQESDLNINKPSSPAKKYVDTAPLLKVADESSAFEVGNYVTGTYKIPNARMRQLKCKIFLPVDIIEVRSLSYFIFQYNIKQLETLMEEMRQDLF